jgi:CRISPR-associated protein Cas2
MEPGMEEHLYIVAYDISNDKRWRKVYKLMYGFGDWLQLSVFQCRLSRKRHAELIMHLDELIHHDEDHVVIMDVGVADKISPRVVNLGNREFSPPERTSVVV